MRTMPPFKATREDRSVMRLEKQGAQRMVAALDKLRRDLFRGVTEANVQQLPARLNNPEVMQPFTDAVTGLMIEWALAGADNGRDEVEMTIYGTA